MSELFKLVMHDYRRLISHLNKVFGIIFSTTDSRNYEALNGTHLHSFLSSALGEACRSWRAFIETLSERS